MRQLLTFLFFLLMCVSKCDAQDSITIRPFWDFQTKAEYEMQYVLWGEGKDMIDTVRFSNRFTAEMTRGNEGHFIVSFTTYNTEQSLPANADGDVNAVMRFLAMDFTVEVDANGKFVSLVNKNDFLVNMGMSPDTPEDELNLIMSSFIETTYGLTFTGMGRTFGIPFSETRDSIVTNTMTPAKTAMTIREDIKTDGKQVQYIKEIHQRVEASTRKESYGEFVYLPTSISEKDIVTLTPAGFITSVHSMNRSDSEGMKVMSDGRETMNTGRMVQNMNLTLTLIE